MAAPFKDQIRRETLTPVAHAIAAAGPGFDAEAFLADACAPLPGLELKARVSHVADTLRQHLDPDIPSALAHLRAALRRDPELYVRRSVANHVGDIAKDHPDLAVELVAGWVAQDGTPESKWIARHGLRHLIKKGHPGALAALGYGPPRVALEVFHVEPSVFTVGGHLHVTAGLTSDSDEDQPLVVDLVIGFVKARGGALAPKTFKWVTPTLKAGGSWNAVKRLPLKPVSTRRYHPGTHSIALQVNGRVLAETEFELRLPEG